MFLKNVEITKKTNKRNNLIKILKLTIYKIIELILNLSVGANVLE